MQWKWADLPPSLLLAVFSYLAYSEALPEQQGNASYQNDPGDDNSLKNTTDTPFFSAANGTGAAYARSCASAYSAYSSGQASWDALHNTVKTTTAYYGGAVTRQVTYYENATTLCDGHPRLTYSPAIALSTAWRTIVEPTTATSVYTDTIGSVYPAPSPSCSIDPKDCDTLWRDYSKSVAAAATITSAPVIQTPPCMNHSAAASWSSVTEKIYGCGLCTIYGEGVELVYFPEPTTVSRDMCASTPTAPLTSYGPGAVISAYAGKSFGANTSSTAGANTSSTAGAKKTAVVDGHTFTTGTAYISISKVYAANRCSKTFGVVTDAILAMPSESVLSLRYSQDHFQRLMETDKVTGYPVSYADFNTPIPWSAWNGQAQCQDAQDDVSCGIIYENYYRPQLAIPPEITSLSPDFEGCQMFYNGLWDPPLALTQAQSAAGPTLPNGHHLPTSTSAQPSQAAPPPTTQPTAIADNSPSTHHDHSPDQYGQPGGASPTSPDTGYSGTDNTKPAPSYGDTSNGDQIGGNGDAGGGSRSKYLPSTEPWSKSFKIGGVQYTAKAEGGKVTIGPITCVAGGAQQTLPDGTVCSYGDTGLVFTTKEKVVFDHHNPSSPGGVQPGGPENKPTMEPGGVSGPTPYGGAGGVSGSTPYGEAGGVSGPVPYGGAGGVSGPTPYGQAGGVSGPTPYGQAGGVSGPMPYGGAGSANTASNPTRTGDSNTVTLTINGEKETVVQQQNGGPVVINQMITLLPGGPAFNFSGGAVISVPQDGSEVIIQSNSTLDVAPTITGGSGSVSGAIRSGLGYGDQSSASSSTTSGPGQPARTGESGGASEGAGGSGGSGGSGSSSPSAAGRLLSFEALNFLVVIVTLVAVTLG
ncbi:hypothetical protein CERZMDRAFT_98830 [Cercospora zeae-maydis SCOH1-5]|uniref:Uncharacterized protein n=1 Tax=Cercospora zeae-maydis SCOH1-5 TaxID=717836 RepID=A0A6A6FC87_9PEZI|nr:hypothetical protein CERZMDRAFT_98830 [Cercospora zeae-maydis SCOH1-5]